MTDPERPDPGRRRQFMHREHVSRDGAPGHRFEGRDSSGTVGRRSGELHRQTWKIIKAVRHERRRRSRVEGPCT